MDKNYKEFIETIKQKIFTNTNIKKGFVERELKELIENDNFYKPETIWFTKEQIEADIPRIIKIISENLNKLRTINNRKK